MRELRNKSRSAIRVVAYLASVGVAILVAFSCVAINRGFGARDLLPFLTWTLAFGIIVSLAAQMLVYPFVKMSAVPRYCFAGATGVVVGVLWTLAVGQFLGPWVGAFSLPILFCWIAGGVSGMTLPMLYHENRKLAALVAIPVILVLSLSTWKLTKSAVLPLSGQQQLEVLVVRWHPGPNPLTNTEVLGLAISESDLEHLKSIGLTGEVMFSASGKYGEGQPARAMIVIQAPLSEPVNLPQPDRSQVIYVQTESGWNRYPREAPTSQKQIRLWTDLRGSSRNTLFSLERADGSSQSGTAVTW